MATNISQNNQLKTQYLVKIMITENLYTSKMYNITIQIVVNKYKMQIYICNMLESIFIVDHFF